MRIRIAHLRADEGEFYVDGHEFKFYLRPYFLRLTFKQSLVEDGREEAKHDASDGMLTCRLPKATPGGRKRTCEWQTSSAALGLIANGQGYA